MTPVYTFLDTTKDFAHAFQKLTKPVLSSNIQSAVTKATSKITGTSSDESPIPAELLDAILKAREKVDIRVYASVIFL